jgi:hypothetical protein
VGVYGRVAAGFTLVASADGRPVALPSGVTVLSTGQPGVYSFFTFTAASNASEVSVSLTSLAGTPGVFVSNVASSQKPTGDTAASYCTGFDSASAANGATGRLVIRPSDACVCKPATAGGPCTYYIGVGASSDFSQWSLVASENNGASLLLDGVPQDAKVAVNTGVAGADTQYFDFSFVPAAVSAASASAATISLTQYTGPGVTLYARFYRAGNDAPPGPGVFDLIARPVDGTSTITIAKNDPMFLMACSGPASQAPCRIRMAVVASGAATQAQGRSLAGGLLIATAPSPALLIAGAPSPSPALLIAGAPSPSMLIAQQADASAAAPSVDPSASVSAAAVAPLASDSASVLPAASASASVVGTSSVTAAASPSATGTGSVAASTTATPSASLTPGASSSPTASVTPSPVSVTPSLSASPSTAASVTPSFSATPSVSPSPVPVLTESTFTIVARTDTGVVLNDAKTQSAVVGQGQMVFFRYTHVAPGSTVVFAATGLSGNVDIYVGVESLPGTVPPSAASPDGYDWGAIAGRSSEGMYSTSTVVVTPDDDAALSCTAPCVYYIGVTPSVNTEGYVSFNLLARARTNKPVSLLDGQPLVDVALAGDFNYYSTQLVVDRANPLGSSLSFAISATGPAPAVTRSGAGAQTSAADGNVTLSAFGRADTAYARLSGTTFDFSSSALTSIGTEVSMVVSATDPRIQATCPALGGLLSGTRVLRDTRNLTGTITCPVSVLLLSETGAVYSVVAVQSAGNTGRMLQDGRPTLAVVAAGGMSYFVFEASAGASHVALSLTALSGSPMMYVSRTNPRPGPTSYDAVAGGLSAAGNTLTFDACPVQALGGASSTDVSLSGGACVFYIAVSAAAPGVTAEQSTSAAFRIQGISSQVAPLSLGQPSFGKANAGGSLSYFSVFVPASAASAPGLEIVVEALAASGYVSIFVGNQQENGVTLLPAAPCTDPSGQACLPGALQAPGGSLYSSYYAIGLQSRTRLLIPSSDPRYTTGVTYVIGLAARKDTEVSIVVRVAGETSTLSAGVATHDNIVTAGATLYYRTLVPFPGSNTPPSALQAAIQATPFMGFLQMFVSTNPSVQKPSSATTGPGVYSAGFLENYRVDLPASVLSGCSRDATTGQCEVFIGVQAISPVLFTLIATTASGSGSSVKRIVPGEAQLDAVFRDSWVYYSAPINATAVNGVIPSIVLSLVSLEGDAGIYLTVDGTLPTTTNYAAFSGPVLGVEYATLNSNNEAYAAAVARAAATNGIVNVIIGVVGEADYSLFSLSLAATDTMTVLLDGQPSQGATEPGGYMYFYLPVEASPGDLSVSLVNTAGNAIVVASRWNNPIGSPDFRPNALPGGYGFRSGSNGNIVISEKDPNACRVYGDADSPDACVYIFAVFCDNSDAEAAQACEYLLTVSSASGGITRIADSLPQRTEMMQGRYIYYFFEAPRGSRNVTIEATAEGNAQVQLLVTKDYTPGLSPRSELPTLENIDLWSNMTQPDGTPVRNFWVSDIDVPVLKFAQFDSFSKNNTGAMAGSGGSSSVVLYTIAIYCVSGPATVTLTATAAMTPLLLVPGIPSSNHFLPFQSVSLFGIDVADLSRDLVVNVAVLYGSVAIAISSPHQGIVSKCAYDSTTKKMNCFGTALWQTTSSTGSAEMRISAKNPCNATSLAPRVPNTSCNKLQDWVRGAYVISIVALDESLVTVTALSSGMAVRIMDGFPVSIRQPADAQRNVFMYTTTAPAIGEPDSDIRFTFAADTNTPPVNFYITSCVDDVCTMIDRHPSPTNFKATGVINPRGTGERRDYRLTRRDPAFCRAPAGTNRVCYYYITALPDRSFCNARYGTQSDCTADFTLTAMLLSSRATVVLDLDTLKDKVTVVQGLAAPNRTTTFWMYVSDIDEETNDVWMRMEACDTLTGYEVAHVCEQVPSVPGIKPCRNLRRPSAADYQYLLSTTPDTDGGEGRSRLGIRNSLSNAMYATVSVPNPRVNYSQAIAAGLGPSTYEFGVFLGNAVHIRPAVMDNVGTFSMRAPDTQTLMLNWMPPVVYSGTGPYQTLSNSSAPVRYARNVTYMVYVAPISFMNSAAQATNTSLGRAFVMPTTPCGLDRWASLVTPTGQPPVDGIPYWPSAEQQAPGRWGRVFTIGDGSTSLRIGYLWQNYTYEANVVAICDDACLRANAEYYGMAIPPSGMSTYRLAYTVTKARTRAPFIPPPEAESTPDSFTKTFMPLGIVGAIAVIAAAAFVILRGGKGPAVVEKAAVPQADISFIPRQPTIRRAFTKGPGSEPVEDAEEMASAAALQSKYSVSIPNPLTNATSVSQPTSPNPAMPVGALAAAFTTPKVATPKSSLSEPVSAPAPAVAVDNSWSAPAVAVQQQVASAPAPALPGAPASTNNFEFTF